MNINDSIVNPLFQWNSLGTPINLKLNDNDGTLTNVTVTDNSYQSNAFYQYNQYKEIIWTLSGNNVNSISRKATWLRPYYFGKKQTYNLPTEAEILTASSVLEFTNVSVTQNPNTLISGEFFWFAIPEADGQSKIFTNWYVDNNNQGLIGAGNFIEDRGTLLLQGITYRVYMYAYETELSNNLTLS